LNKLIQMLFDPLEDLGLFIRKSCAGTFQRAELSQQQRDELKAAVLTREFPRLPDLDPGPR
jgi:hypothetical protein